MADKVEGATSTCSDCNQPIVCRKITYEGKEKLQWQDKEKEKAHYSYDFKTKKVSCKHSAKEEEPTASKGIDFKKMLSEKEGRDPTPEQYLELATKLISSDPDIGSKDEFIAAHRVETKRRIAIYLIERAEIEKNMNELGLQHPSRESLDIVWFIL